MKKEYLIGVDGGATKSSALLADIKGKIITKRAGQALNYQAVGQKKVEKNLKKLLYSLLKEYKQIKTVAIGFAGLNTRHDLRIYKRIVKKVLPKKTNLFLFNDAQIALEAACPDRGRAKILIISGTGSSVYGEFKNRQAKAIGWDFLVGDEGSAYWMGLEAFKKAVQSWDGREKKTILEKLVLQKSRSKNMPQFLSKLYQNWHQKPENFKRYIASFSLEVGRASLKGDPAAKKIIEEAAEKLAAGVEAVIKNLRVKKPTVPTQEPLCIGFVGSNFKIPQLLPSLCSKIKKIYPQVKFVYGVNPAQGAINLAVKLC